MPLRIKVILVDHNDNVLARAWHDVEEREFPINLKEPLSTNVTEAGMQAESIIQQLDHRRDYLKRMVICCADLMAEELADKEGLSGNVFHKLIQQVNAWKLIGGYPFAKTSK